MICCLRGAVFAVYAVALLAMSSAYVRAAQDATPAAACATTSPEENKALAKAYWDEAVWGKQGKIAEIVAPDEVHHWGIGSDTTGFNQFQERWALFNQAFPDLRFTVDLVAAEGDLAATVWTATGTQTGEWQGIAPTGKEVTWTGINVFRIACGKIAESWGEADHIGLRAQLGATDVPSIPAPPGETSSAALITATPCAEDTPENNLALARQWTDEAISNQNLGVIDEILAPDVVHHGATFPNAHGIAGVKEAIGRVNASFPEQLTIDATIVDGDVVFVRYSGTGTHNGEYFGIAATGKEVPLSGINAYRISCGKIVESWSEINGLELLRAIQEAAGTPTP
jgi:predicted ester cyclase